MLNNLLAYWRLRRALRKAEKVGLIPWLLEGVL